jgi:hypothetical protein
MQRLVSPTGSECPVLAQNRIVNRVANSTKIQIENGALSAQRTSVHHAANGCMEPFSVIGMMSRVEQIVGCLKGTIDPERKATAETFHASLDTSTSCFLNHWCLASRFILGCQLATISIGGASISTVSNLNLSDRLLKRRSGMKAR